MSIGPFPAVRAQASGQAAGQVAGQVQYQLSAAQQLKGEGNRLHMAGKYGEAAAKYERAQGNIAGESGQAPVIDKALDPATRVG